MTFMARANHLRANHLSVFAVFGTLLSFTAVACTRAEAAEKAVAKPVAAQKIAVKTVEVSRKSLPKTLTITGTLIANRESEVAADIAGRVVESAIERGQRVEKGALLARLDSRSAVLSRAVASAELETARVHRDNASLECERAEQLFASSALSRAELDRTRANCRASDTSTQAALARTRVSDKAIADAFIRAPFAGVVTDRAVDVGEYVTPGRRIATLVEINPLRLELSIPESATAAVQQGRDVQFSVRALPEKRFRASVRYVGPVLRRSTHDLVIEAVVDNTDGALRPGMFAEAELNTGEQELSVVPKESVRGAGAAARVFVVKDGRVEERVVLAAEPRGNDVPVISGLDVGERVVTSPSAEVVDGALTL
ncbi:MAG TPA: efflux RND transporter periplasmic adaptor subunit [Polyangiaceae bacterium]|nr:efflux RND transporter periplasmic adaptor subunit [Polyangiaceae bacterium]